MKKVTNILLCLLFLFSIFLPQLGVAIGKEAMEITNARLLPVASQPKIYQDTEEDFEMEAQRQLTFNEVIKNTLKSAGLFTLYRDREKEKIYVEIKPEQLNKNYLAFATMESGVGERELYSTTPLNYFLFYFQRTGNNLQFVVRNVQFRTSSEDPQRSSIERSFSDSVLASVRIISIHPESKSILIDLNDLLVKDLPDLSSQLQEYLGAEYAIDKKKSYLGTTKVFPLNLEIDYNYGFSLRSSGTEGNSTLLSLPDRRALNIRVHYSLSELPANNGYVPRLADERVGYFTTVYKNFSDRESRSPLVRYINRWNLEKQDPNSPLSPPKQPIIFWIENTVPVEYRQAIAEGVLMWNKAFEKAGFKNAIEVHQMPDNAPWHPADVRYNTIRWFASTDAAFAVGPSRVNLLTGQILDADISIDSNMVRVQQQEYRTFVQQTSSNNICQPLRRNKTSPKDDICYGKEMTHQLAIGSMALSLFQNVVPNSKEMKEYVHQYLRHVIAHEVGHTLGLRHNFRGSTLLTPEELQNTDITRTKGMVSSVMDYIGVNLTKPDIKQGDYYPTVVGVYDDWAIEYGYKPSGMPTPPAEKQFLSEIAQRQNDNLELSYATDEDILDNDPTVNLFDMSSQPLLYSQSQLDIAWLLWERLSKNYPASSSNLGELREMFDDVLLYYVQNVRYISKYIGGEYFYRERAAIANGKLPFEVVPIAKQREALAALQKYFFGEDAFKFNPELLNRLAPSRWDDWNPEQTEYRLDYPIHDRILFWQSRVLQDLLSGERLTSLRDIELKTPAGQALTMPELFKTLQNGIWTEVLQTDKKEVKISSLRRALQREYLDILVKMVLRTEAVPEDARSLAWQKLRQLRENLNSTLRKQGRNMDDYTKAHLQETSDRITKVLDAPLRSR